MILALYIAAVCADVASTLYAKTRPQVAREGNFYRKLGVLWIPVRLGIAALILALYFNWDGVAPWVLVAGFVFYFAVAASNVLIARRAA